MTRIALVGYGKMGREIERIAAAAGTPVVAAFDIDRPLAEGAYDFDVAIEFSTPGTVIANIEQLAAHGKQIVVGTTGWNDRLADVAAIVEKHNGGLIYSSNFSVGMYLFRRLVADAARAFSAFDGYDIAVHEAHHRLKLDAPSGTALTLALDIIAAWPSKTRVATAVSPGGVPADALHVSSTRVGAVVGEHTVTIDSAADSIALTHTAHSRAGFASGALLAAGWIAGRRGIYSMDDMMASIIKT